MHLKLAMFNLTGKDLPRLFCRFIMCAVTKSDSTADKRLTIT